MARRYDHVQEVAAEAGGDAVALQCDVRKPIACELAVQAAVQQLDGLDTVVFATGINRLAWLAETTVDAWRDLVDTNLIGAALVTQAVLPHPSRTRTIGYLSSHSVAQPWPGLGAYAATKAALDAMIGRLARRGGRAVAFTRFVVGPTVTGMADCVGPGDRRDHVPVVGRCGDVRHEPVTAGEWVADQIVAWAASDEPVTDVPCSSRRRLNGVEGRAVIVTGAGQGIGRGMALHLAKNGAAVAVVDWKEHRVERTVAELQALGAEAIGVTSDISDHDSITAMVATVVERFGASMD